MKTLLYLTLLLTTIVLAAGFAHVFALPNKIGLPRDDYFTVQQIYSGWALLGIPLVGALISGIVLTITARGQSLVFPLALLAVLCIGLGLAVFFALTFPANQATANWTTIPENWESLRTRWEYGHLISAILYFIAWNALAFAALRCCEPTMAS